MLSLFGFSKNKAQAKSIHSFKVEALDGSTIDFSKFKGKKNIGCEYCFRMWIYTSIC